MAYNTGNPIGSSDVRDLKDNVEDLDILMLSQTLLTNPDRLGVQRKTIYGYQNDFNNFLAASGFEPVHLVYTAGSSLTVNRPTQLIDYSGSVYRVKMPATFPVVLSGTWATDSAKLVDVGDMSLRQALALGTGAGLVGFKAAGSSSVLRTVLARLADTVSVDDYITSGMTDHSIALQAAIDTGARRVISGALGSYNLATVVNLRSNLLLDLGGALLTCTASSTINAMLYGVDVVDVTIKSGSLNCASKSLSGVRIYSNTVGSSRIFCTGLHITGTANDTTLQYGGIEVASLQGLSGPQNHHVVITDCEFRSCGTHGALVYHTVGVQFNDNLVIAATNHGMEAVGCYDVTINGNRVQDCLISGLGVGAGTSGFLIANNMIRNCGGDGSITVEHNSTNGTVEGNTVLDCRTSGINVSWGSSGLSVSDRIRNISVKGNVLQQAQNIKNFVGINVYSSTSYIGTGVTVEGNIIDGFQRPIEYAYMEDGYIKNNVIDNTYQGADFAAKVTYCQKVLVEGNILSLDCTGHAFQFLNYSTSQNDLCSLIGNSIIAAGTAQKSLAYIEGTGTFYVKNNRVGGALHYVDAPNAAKVFVSGNVGNLAGTPYNGATVVGSLDGPVVGTAGALLGYMTVYNPVVGNVKIPYYALS